MSQQFVQLSNTLSDVAAAPGGNIERQSGAQPQGSLGSVCICTCSTSHALELNRATGYRGAHQVSSNVFASLGK